MTIHCPFPPCDWSLSGPHSLALVRSLQAHTVKAHQRYVPDRVASDCLVNSQLNETRVKTQQEIDEAVRKRGRTS